MRLWVTDDGVDIAAIADEFEPDYIAAGRRANELVSELRTKWRPLYGSDVKAIVDAALASVQSPPA